MDIVQYDPYEPPKAAVLLTSWREAKRNNKDRLFLKPVQTKTMATNNNGDHHVHFPEIQGHDGPHRSLPSPPPEHHVHFPNPVGDREHMGPHRNIPSPPPEHHVYFPTPVLGGDLDHESQGRKLDSPPPPAPETDLSPKLLSKTDESVGVEEDKNGEEAPGSLPKSPVKMEDTLSAGGASAESSSTPRFSSKKLRGNLTRQQKNRDPLFFYEIISVLGVGSMGSVAKVRKRRTAIGGSARKAVQERVKHENRVKACFQLPIIGGLFQYCLKDSNLFSPPDEDASRHSDLVMRPNASSIDEGSATSSEMIYAMKSIHLSRVSDDVFVEELKNEIQILKTLDHPHIVKAIEVFEHRNQIFVIMELCSGGDLYSRDPYTEEEAARITCSILAAIAYIHSKGILHRDLKYENILFVNDSPLAEIKLIDFGLSRMFGNEELTDGVGTIYTMAPEVLKGKYTKQADLWSVGVIAYMLLSSQMPFYGRKRSQIVTQIMEGKYEYKGRRWKKVSKQAKAFCDDLLVVDPNDRASTEEALRATWLNRRFGATVRNPDVQEMDDAKNSMVKFADYSKLRKVALMVVAHKSTSAEIGILRKVFQQYDKRRLGRLRYEEFKAAISDAGFKDEECRKIFDAVDLDGSGEVKYTEFLAATIEAQGALSEERLAEAFDRIDADDSGFISAENLLELLGDDFPKEEIDSIIKEVSTEKEGKISYAEFLALWEDRNEKEREQIIQEITVLKRVANSDRSLKDNVSVLSGEESESEHDGDNILSRAAFIDEKLMSERKVAAEEALEEAVAQTDKRVAFQDAVTTIPDDCV